MNPRESFIYIIKNCIGRPYKWGGQSWDGFDCSGLVIYALNQAGIPTDDTTAQGLYILYHINHVEQLQAPPGSLYFYGVGIHAINHVMVVVEHWNTAGIVLVGARGGDSAINTPEDAAAHRCFVDAVWGDYWNNKFIIAVDPFQGKP